MATVSCPANTKEAIVAVVDRRDSEAGPYLPIHNLPPFPRWPRIIGAAFNAFILLASISIIGILAHSLHNYSGTRGIHFGGTAISWPKDLNLHPAYLILAASAMGIVPCLAATVVNLYRSKASSCSTMEKVMTFISGVLLVMWIVGEILQGVSEKTPKKDLLSWACRRKSSPTNIMVSYTSICDEQRAVKYLAILITIAELGSLFSYVTIWYLTKRRSRLVDEPWRMKA
ncbi:MAG: hypothetical protein Q9225_006184 [Loekoesia sp. 1 TL-2023]